MSILYKPINLVERELDFIPKAMLMGAKGAGMTTLHNNISNVTPKQFELLAIPGARNREEQIQKDKALENILSFLKLNAIFILVKYETRIKEMIKNFVNEFNLVENYSHKIVIIVTHWDNCIEPERHSEDISKAFKDYCRKIIFYSRKDTNSEQMAKLIYRFISHLEAKKRNFIVEKIINFYFKKKRCSKSLISNESDLATNNFSILQMIFVLFFLFVIVMAFKKDFNVELNLMKD